MRRKDINIIAINPGTKYLGLAVFQRSDLVYWGVKVLKGRWSKEKMRSAKMTILNLINQHAATTIVLKRPHPSRSSRNLNRLVKTIAILAEEEKLRIYPYSLSDLKDFLAPGVKSNKTDIAGLVAVRYRFLINQLERQGRHKHPYFLRMFEAIAAGILALKRIKD